eukprot:2789450-Karenia_brevis.AAC.1
MPFCSLWTRDRRKVGAQISQVHHQVSKGQSQECALNAPGGCEVLVDTKMDRDDRSGGSCGSGCF